MKKILGTVKSLKNINTAQVLVFSKWQHPIYKKYVKRSKSYACHYEGLELSLGDRVVIVPCRPMSKSKKFKVERKAKTS